MPDPLFRSLACMVTAYLAWRIVRWLRRRCHHSWPRIETRDQLIKRHGRRMARQRALESRSPAQGGML